MNETKEMSNDQKSMVIENLKKAFDKDRKSREAIRDAFYAHDKARLGHYGAEISTRRDSSSILKETIEAVLETVEEALDAADPTETVRDGLQMVRKALEAIPNEYLAAATLKGALETLETLESTFDARDPLEVALKMALAAFEADRKHRATYVGRVPSFYEPLNMDRAVRAASAAVREQRAAVRGQRAAVREQRTTVREQRTTVREQRAAVREQRATDRDTFKANQDTREANYAIFEADYDIREADYDIREADYDIREADYDTREALRDALEVYYDACKAAHATRAQLLETIVDLNDTYYTVLNTQAYSEHQTSANNETLGSNAHAFFPKHKEPDSSKSQNAENDARYSLKDSLVSNG